MSLTAYKATFLLPCMGEKVWAVWMRAAAIITEAEDAKSDCTSSSEGAAPKLSGPSFSKYNNAVQ